MFESKLSVQFLGQDWSKCRLLSPLSYITRDRWIVAVPKGFVTDGASVPRVLWNIFPPWGEYARAAVVHDWLYHRQIVSRKRSDKIFLEAMADIGCPRRVRYTMWSGVRLGGWTIWHKRKRDRKK